jgi:hypothetical protein
MSEETKIESAELKQIQFDAEAELCNLLYAATAIIEQMEHKGLILGNGHHARQAVVEFAIAELRRRWRDPQPGLTAATAWQRKTAQRDHNGAYFVPIMHIAEIESDLHKGRSPLSPGTFQAKNE